MLMTENKTFSIRENLKFIWSFSLFSLSL